ncbi:MAG: CRISPR-associated endonuclease Cas2, partial [Anaerotignaceae bacterium]
MLVLITYDVNTETAEGRRRLNKIAKQCVNNGQRVQNSVFECVLNWSQFASLKNNLEKIADPKKDSLRYYMLGEKWETKVT